MAYGSGRWPDLLPSLACGVSAALWGAFWIPLRLLDAGGLGGAWSVLGLYLLALVLLAPVAVWRRRRIVAAGRGWILTGILTGGAFCLYSNAFLNTEVVRALLLFYLMPVWASLLARLILNEPITGTRLLAIGFGLAGLFVMLGLGSGVPLPRNAGDWMALVAGMIWAYACVRLRQTASVGALEQTFGFFLWGVIWGAAILLLPLEGRGPVPDPGALAPGTLVILGLTALFVVGANVSVIWGARLLSPGRVGILLMAELISGPASAAVLTDEPFGPREIAGGALIAAAGAIEIFYRRRRSRPRAGTT